MKEQFEKIGDGLLVRAPGKINISLLVAGKREDGYHNIESIMAKIEWFDEIVIELKTEDRRQRTEDGIKNIELICKGEYKVPEGEENLVYKAAKEILKIKNQKVKSSEEDRGQKAEDGRQKAEGRMRNTEENAGKMPATLRITLAKNMPAGSGLGSGSSDAAATLMGINEFLKLRMGKKELADLAAQLGSDVAFFLDGPMALCTGRGEKVKKLAKCEFGALLVVPDVSVSTKRVYENYRHDEAKYKRLREEINIYIDKKRIDLICSMGANMLQESCFELHPEIGVLKKRIESIGVRPVCLSGSGSSMYCIINNINDKGVKTYRDRIEQEFGCRSIILNNNSW